MEGVRNMKCWGVLICFGALVLIASLSWAQQDFSTLEIHATAVGGTVHVHTSNAAGDIRVSVGADGPLVVDYQFAPLAPKNQSRADKSEQRLSQIYPEYPLARRSCGRQFRIWARTAYHCPYQRG